MTTLLEKRIPVSEQRWKELGQLKGAGQTYDDLLGDMLLAYRLQRLASLRGAVQPLTKKESVAQMRIIDRMSDSELFRAFGIPEVTDVPRHDNRPTSRRKPRVHSISAK